jgi:predicted DNA-binding ribbon-helix-helix protein
MGSLITRNVVLNGRRTSLRLEGAIWDALEEIAEREGCSVNALCAHVDTNRDERTLTASIRVYVLRYFREAATADAVRCTRVT